MVWIHDNGLLADIKIISTHQLMRKKLNSLQSILHVRSNTSIIDIRHIHKENSIIYTHTSYRQIYALFKNMKRRNELGVWWKCI